MDDLQRMVDDMEQLYFASTADGQAESSRQQRAIQEAAANVFRKNWNGVILEQQRLGDALLARVAKVEQGTKSLRDDVFNATATPALQAVRFVLDDRPIILIDTPGFDDEKLSDVEILSNVPQWMVGEGMMGNTNQSLDALILVHPVTRNSPSSMEARRTRLLKTLLGKDAYKRVTIITTMWDSLETSYASRMRSQFDFKTIMKQNKQDKWTDFCKDGASIEKHDNAADSARKILCQIIKRQGDTTNSSLFLLGAAFWQRLKEDLEEDMDHLHEEMIHHREERPRSVGTKKWDQWIADKEELDKQSKRCESQLKKVKALLVSPSLLSQNLLHKMT
ncbi:hypothetical protein OQA88_5580 [Cercophora sp. LCS_1]